MNDLLLTKICEILGRSKLNLAMHNIFRLAIILSSRLLSRTLEFKL